MAAVAKVPAKKTSPIVWVGLVAAVVAVYVFLTPPDSSASGVTTGATKKKKTVKDASGLTALDYKMAKEKFPPIQSTAINAFNPLVKRPKPLGTPISLNTNPSGIPVKLTGGEANWYYTGWDSLDGAREALFENTSSGETIYVKPGQQWKSARVQSIDVSVVTLVGRDGVAVDVPIQQYGEVPGAAKTPLALNAPLAVPGGALTGAIGGRAVGPQSITLSNGQILALPPADASVAPTDPSTDPNNQGGGRRRRRNRNQNPATGDPNNGF